LTNELLESNQGKQKDPNIFNVEEEKKEEAKIDKLIEEGDLLEDTERLFKEIFDVNQQDLIDLFEAADLHKEEDSREGFEVFGIDEELKEPLAPGACSDGEENENLKDLLVDFAFEKQAK
jgi:hypothetical protein